MNSVSAVAQLHDELARLPPCGCSFVDTVHRNQCDVAEADCGSTGAMGPRRTFRWAELEPVLVENSNPNILMVEPAQDWQRNNEVERVLADIDADDGDFTVEFLGHGVLLCLRCPLASLAY